VKRLQLQVKNVTVTISTTEKTGEAVAATSEETKSTSRPRANAPQIQSIIGLEEELDINTTNSSTTPTRDNKNGKLKHQETRGHRHGAVNDLKRWKTVSESRPVIPENGENSVKNDGRFLAKKGS
jgi:hypothetical protein